MLLSTMTLMGSRWHRTLLAIGITVLIVLIYMINPGEDAVWAPSFHAVHVHSGRKLQGVPATEDTTIHAQERHHLTYRHGGYLFKETGRSYSVEVELTTCLIHSFSPYVEREAARRFLDPPHNNIYYANSPGVLWFKGELVLVARIWLDRERYEPKNDWPPNHFGDNFLYTQKFNHQLQPLNNGSIIGIPAPKQWWVGDGPIEPRLFSVKDRLFISFNVAMAFGPGQFMDYTIMWDYERNVPIIPKIEGDTPMKNATAQDDIPRDKHWMALVQNNELYFVHNLDPLRIMKCSLMGFCEFVHHEKSKRGFIFSDLKSHIRGGTPFELYEWPYYISVAHSTMYKTSNQHRYYTAHMVVLCVRPYRVVYVSNDIRIHEKIYRSAPMVRPRWIDDGFIFPVGIIIENKDWLTLGVHVNDFSSVLIRLKGLSKLMNTIIKLDQRQAAKQGPPVGYLQQHIHDTQTNLTHMTFIDE